MVEPLRLLIIGAGAVVSEYYLPALMMLGWDRYTTVVDPASSALMSSKAVCSEAAVCQMDFRATLNDPSITRLFDAAVVALPNSLHEEATQLALERGLHVLCEKPLAPTRDACWRLGRVAEQANRTLAVGMVRRLLPSLSMMREGIAQQIIGDLVAIDVEDGEPYNWLSQSGAYFQKENGGVLADMGVHYLDFVWEIGGELVPLSYWDDFRGGVEANAVLRLKTSLGIPVRLALSRTRMLRNSLVCRGERGELIAEKETFDSCVWHSNSTGSFSRLAPTRPFSSETWPPTLRSCFAQQLVNLATSIRSGGAPSVSAETAGLTSGLIEWAYCHRDTQPVALEATGDPECCQLPEGKVLVTGATGFIGTHLIERLRKCSGIQVVAPVRNYRTCAEIARFALAMPRVDVLDYEAVRESVAGARFVFHLAYGRDGHHPERVTVQGTRNVVEAAIATGSDAVVVLSTIYVFGQPNGEVDESWPYDPTGGEYGVSKAKMEKWCLARARTSHHTRIVVLCPSCVYGPRGRTYSAMPVRMVGDGLFCWIDNGIGIANYTFVENLVDAMLLAAISTNAHGQRFIISDGWTTWRAFLGQLLGEGASHLPSYTRRELRRLHEHTPRPSVMDIVRLMATDQQLRSAVRQTLLADAALRATERLAPALLDRLRQARPAAHSLLPVRSRSSISPEWLADLFGPASTVFVAEKARRVLGWSSHVPLDAGMSATRAWLCGDKSGQAPQIT